MTQLHQFTELLSSVDDTLFEVSPDLRCFRWSSRYCCYGKHICSWF